MLSTVEPSLLYLLQRSSSAGFSRAKIGRSGRLELACMIRTWLCNHPDTRTPVPRAHRKEPAQELPTAQDDDDNGAFFPSTADDDCELEHRPSMDTAPENLVAVPRFILD
jgi:hypothetical protein